MLKHKLSPIHIFLFASVLSYALCVTDGANHFMESAAADTCSQTLPERASTKLCIVTAMWLGDDLFARSAERGGLGTL